MCQYMNTENCRCEKINNFKCTFIKNGKVFNGSEYCGLICYKENNSTIKEPKHYRIVYEYKNYCS